MYKESTVPLHRRKVLDLISSKTPSDWAAWQSEKGETPVESSKTNDTFTSISNCEVLDLITTKG